MNILTAKYQGADKELIEVYEPQLVFLNAIIGKESTEDQLAFVRQSLTAEGWDNLIDAIMASFVVGVLEGDDDDFITKMKFCLLELQFNLGEQPQQLRGQGNSNQL